MKSFAVFPTITIFFLAFTLLRMVWGLATLKNLVWSLLIAIVLGGLLAILSDEILFYYLYRGNFIFAFVLIISLTFLMNDLCPEVSGREFWIRLCKIGIAATALTLALLATTLLHALNEA